MKTEIPLNEEERLIYVVLGARIASKRRAKGITQEDLADGLGMSRASLANIETGRQGVLLHVAIRICDRLKMKVVSS